MHRKKEPKDIFIRLPRPVVWAMTIWLLFVGVHILLARPLLEKLEQLLFDTCKPPLNFTSLSLLSSTTTFIKSRFSIFVMNLAMILLTMSIACIIAILIYWDRFNSRLWLWQRAHNVHQKIDDLLQKTFYKVVKLVPGDIQFGWRHYILFKQLCWIIFLTLYIIPLLFHNTFRAFTISVCSSPTLRGWSSDICVTPFLRVSGIQSPWYVDMWNEQENDVRLPSRVFELVTGYYHVCNAENYLHDHLLKINMSPKDIRNEGLYQEISK